MKLVVIMSLKFSIGMGTVKVTSRDTHGSSVRAANSVAEGNAAHRARCCARWVNRRRRETVGEEGKTSEARAIERVVRSRFWADVFLAARLV